MAKHPWAAPYRDRPIDATVRLPGSKSLTNRALVLSALADTPSTISAPLRSRDTELMAQALSGLGVGIARTGDAWTVTPPRGVSRGRTRIDCGLAGTVMRFLPPAVGVLTRGTVTFDGDSRARERPMRTVLDAIRALGVEVDDAGRGTLPFDVHALGTVPGGRARIDASASSQFVSALLLAGARYDRGVEVSHVGEPVPSAPHVAMTVTQLRQRGVEVDDSEAYRWTVAPAPVAAQDLIIEPDLSNAGAFVAAALATRGTVRVRDWPTETDQAGDRWREIAAQFGAEVDFDGDDLVVSASHIPRGVRLDLHEVGELAPVVAAVCALSEEPSQITGIGHLRGHETDRLASIANEVNRMGGCVDELDDGLDVRPRPLHPAVLHTYADHRMAHAAAVLGLAVEGTRVVDVDTASKTFPGFAAAWERFVA